jgi:hypothetical protein
MGKKFPPLEEIEIEQVEKDRYKRCSTCLYHQSAE